MCDTISNDEESYYYPGVDSPEKDYQGNFTTGEFITEFESISSGASDSIPVSIHDLKLGSYIVMNLRPCKITSIKVVKIGKHGHAKASIVAEDIFNEKKYEEVCPASQTKYAPIVKREEYTLLTYDVEGYASLMNSKGCIREDLKLPTETDTDMKVLNKIKVGLEEDKVMMITVLSAMGIEKIEDAKPSTEN